MPPRGRVGCRFAQFGANPSATTGTVAAAFLTCERLAAAPRRAASRGTGQCCPHGPHVPPRHPLSLCKPVVCAARPGRLLGVPFLPATLPASHSAQRICTSYSRSTSRQRATLRVYVTCAALCAYGMLRYSDLTNVMVHADLVRFASGMMELPVAQ